MPNRIVREGILTSEAVNGLKPHAELFYRRLMSVVDDFGRTEAHPSLLRARCYPLQLDRIRDADLSRWLDEVEAAGLVVVYEVEGKKYLELKNFGQRTRATKSRCPAPADGCPTSDGHMSDKRPSHAHGDGYGGADGDGDESAPDGACSEGPPERASPPPDPVVLEFPCRGNPRVWELTESKLAEYRETYPGLDVMAEARAARQWCRDNPEKQKTAKGMPGFLTRWMKRACDRGGSNVRTGSTQAYQSTPAGAGQGAGRNGARQGEYPEPDKAPPRTY